MKELTIDHRKPVKAEGLHEQPTRTVVVTIGRKRYELTSHTAVREITRGPAKLIQMPRRPTIG